MRGTTSNFSTIRNYPTQATFLIRNSPRNLCMTKSYSIITSFLSPRTILPQQRFYYQQHSITSKRSSSGNQSNTRNHFTARNHFPSSEHSTFGNHSNIWNHFTTSNHSISILLQVIFLPPRTKSKAPY
jgi:hypothetical protein